MPHFLPIFSTTHYSELRAIIIWVVGGRFHLFSMDFIFYNTLEHESDIREGDENSQFDRMAGMNVFLPHQRLKGLDGFGLEFFLQLQKKSVCGTATELPEVDV